MAFLAVFVALKIAHRAIGYICGMVMDPRLQIVPGCLAAAAALYPAPRPLARRPLSAHSGE